jgi:hypothetical protein
MGVAEAAPVRRLYQDVKLPTQEMLEHQTVTPVAASTSYVKAATYAGPTSAAVVTLTSFLAQPDVPRNIVITPGATTGDVESCVIVVSGTNIFNAAITENFTFAADASSAQTGAKAFKTVSSVVFPANCESGGFNASWTIGIGEKIGLNRCMANNGSIVQTNVGGAKETTFPTVVSDSDEVEKNTADFNGTMNGSNLFDILFYQNFGCFP